MYLLALLRLLYVVLLSVLCWLVYVCVDAKLPLAIMYIYVYSTARYYVSPVYVKFTVYSCTS